MKTQMKNTAAQNPSRRKFLKESVALMGGLVIGFYLPTQGGRAYAGETPPNSAKQVYPPDAFIHIAPDDSITIVVNKSEMGQGVYTSLPMLIAEELEADWSRISVVSAPVGAVYNHTGFGMQLTGGSTSIPSSWEQMRRVGASARILLVRAAAQQWGVPESECHAGNSRVIHAGSGREASYGALADAAAKLPMPDDVVLKSPKDFKIIGKPMKRLDTPAKINGTAQFGLDVYLPGVLTVLVARSPVFGGKVKSFDATGARKLPGVQGVYQVPTGVAVAASGFWPAKTARDLLVIEWDEGPGAALSTPKMTAEYLALARQPGLVARKDGDTVQGFKKTHKSVTAEYEVPYLAHAAMEPLNVVVDLKPDSCVIWTGTQMQTMDCAMAAKTAGLKPEQVQIHTTFLGGGFGRRANPRSDFVIEAVQVAMAVGKPVKVVWTREDDTRGGYYRPMWADHIEAGIAKDGKPLAWKHTIVGQSIVADTPFEGFMTHNGIDATSVEGASTLPYMIPNLQVELHSTKNAVPVQWWRSVGHSHTAFVVETMVDELAHLAGKDPVAYRMAMLPATSRYRGVLQLAADKAGWGKKKLPAGHAYGVAVHQSFNSYVAQIAEVSVDSGKIRVHRVVAAVDCGMIVNPDGIHQQIEGAIVFGLSAALHGAITLEKGRVMQSNFNDYPPLRYSEMPQIEVHIVASSEPPTGIGEPGTPPIAPAVANAVFKLTGKRMRRMPFDREKLA
ncbi:MAG: Aerobic-type carbon monoxide dehydrogenase, large subunit CoxL-like protein [Candidatus Gallionella acididurans]|uniref:Aerobic-type carbon monoxide dehydrogenase, large subunit CoxL-like protein n=1 Tax=Candidatus Gallionella acididurans TaxID=1796491 RepID=A0A139BV45_9PROT|nr:MAG: Aerobic-type carbon monoxide dehydrogenase, large subunit CoxL-like protein [Candidatus Gallionella acididurans]